MHLAARWHSLLILEFVATRAISGHSESVITLASDVPPENARWRSARMTRLRQPETLDQSPNIGLLSLQAISATLEGCWITGRSHCRPFRQWSFLAQRGSRDLRRSVEIVSPPQRGSVEVPYPRIRYCYNSLWPPDKAKSRDWGLAPPAIRWARKFPRSFAHLWRQLPNCFLRSLIAFDGARAFFR